MRFQFTTAGTVEFGAGCVSTLATHVRGLGTRVLVVCGHDESRARSALTLPPGHSSVATFSIAGEPTVACVEEGVAVAKASAADTVVGFGGGSVIDAAKAIAVLMNNSDPVLEYLEVVGAGKPLVHSSAPCIAIPTTAGTGSEVTRNAVLGVPEAGLKVSLRHVSMLPRCAIVDPRLTLSVPRSTTAATGCDALTQVIEPFVSRFSNPFTDCLCRDAIKRAAIALPRVCADGSDLSARTELSFVSLCGGLALANSKLGAVHGLAGVLGGRYQAPHGMLCAALLAPCFEANARALQARAPESPLLARFDEVAQLLVEDGTARAKDGAEWLGRLAETLGLPRLGSLGVEPNALHEIVELSLRTSSMKGNPIDLEPTELHSALERAL